MNNKKTLEKEAKCVKTVCRLTCNFASCETKTEPRMIIYILLCILRDVMH